MAGHWKTFHSCYITVIIVQFLHYCCEKFLAFMCPLYVVITCIISVWGAINCKMHGDNWLATQCANYALVNFMPHPPTPGEGGGIQGI